MRLAYDIPGLIEMLLGKELWFDDRLMTSIALVTLISIGRDRSTDSLYFPRRKKSLILWSDSTVNMWDIGDKISKVLLSSVIFLCTFRIFRDTIQDCIAFSISLNTDAIWLSGIYSNCGGDTISDFHVYVSLMNIVYRKLCGITRLFGWLSLICFQG